MRSHRRDLIAAARVVAAASLTVLLVACGGGGGDDAAGAPVAIKDSFGALLAADAGFTAGDAGLDGTVAEGRAAAGASVLLTDMDGRRVAAAADAQGYYRMKVTGLRPPFVLRATTTSGRVLHSLDVRPVRNGAFVTVNVSSLTDKIASDLAVQAGLASPELLTPEVVDAHQRHIATSVAFLRAAFADLLTAAGVDAVAFDPLTVPFRADHTGYDLVLDHLQVSSDASAPTYLYYADGQVLIGPPGQGWQSSVVRDGQTWVTGGGAMDVPKQADLARLDVAAVAYWLAPPFDGSAKVEGNTVTFHGPDTDFVVRVDQFAATDFEACEVCEVGDTVSYTVRGTVTWGGTLHGQVVPTETIDRSATFVYESVV
jgi:hypothetical protein